MLSQLLQSFVSRPLHLARPGSLGNATSGGQLRGQRWWVPLCPVAQPRTADPASSANTSQDIHAFAVDPKHQGRGAGAALVQTLIDLGNSNRLPIYLESSPGSQGLYRKMGFWNVPCEIARAVHHVDVLGVEKAVEVPLMVKLPDSMTLSSELKEGKQLDDVYMDWCRQDAEDDNSI